MSLNQIILFLFNKMKKIWNQISTYQNEKAKEKSLLKELTKLVQVERKPPTFKNSKDLGNIDGR